MEERRWIRTCQECGHEQVAKKPSTEHELTDSYRNSKCRKCHSEALDYGTYESLPGDMIEDEEDSNQS